MRAVVCNAFGPPEDLAIVDIDEPTVGDGQVLIDVKAVPVTFPDTLMLEDKYQFKVPLPYVPGGEVSGVVAAIGGGVDRIAVGDRVVASTGVSGGFAERALAKASDARILPDSVGFAESTGLGYAYGTTYYGLKWRGQLAEGETLLVLGAGGHLGMTAIEIGKLMGATVIAAASTDAKLDLCRRFGADMTINYAQENLKDRAKELTDGKGVDVIYDPVGGEYAESALRASAWGGRFLVIGFTAGIPSVPLNLTLLKSCSIVGVFYGAMMANEPKLGAEIMADLLEMTGSGKLNPHISERYSLDEAPKALRSMMDRRAIGKIVIEP
ncbi:MAG: NADPH:quinone oxidoreductase family protein [Acidimicrobiales bacterium]